MKTIRLNDGYEAIVDDEDFTFLSQWSWSYDGKGYARRNEQMPDGRQRTIRMHRVIMGSPPGDVDHINRNSLDNRRENLRAVTHTQNLFNSGAHKNNTSGFKGVSFSNRDRKWRAEIRIGAGRRLSLGYFDTAQDAAAAYAKAAAQHHGEFAIR